MYQHLCDRSMNSCLASCLSVGIGPGDFITVKGTAHSPFREVSERTRLKCIARAQHQVKRCVCRILHGSYSCDAMCRLSDTCETLPMAQACTQWTHWGEEGHICMATCLASACVAAAARAYRWRSPAPFSLLTNLLPGQAVRPLQPGFPVQQPVRDSDSLAEVGACTREQDDKEIATPRKQHPYE